MPRLDEWRRRYCQENVRVDFPFDAHDLKSTIFTGHHHQRSTVDRLARSLSSSRELRKSADNCRSLKCAGEGEGGELKINLKKMKL